MSNEPDDRIVNPNDSAVFVGDCVPNYNITFHKNEEQIGVLDFNGPEMTFTGKADESARVFFDFIADIFRERLADIEALQKENEALRATQAELVVALRGLLHLEEETLRGPDDDDFCQEVRTACAALAKVEAK